MKFKTNYVILLKFTKTMQSDSLVHLYSHEKTLGLAKPTMGKLPDNEKTLFAIRVP